MVPEGRAPDDGADDPTFRYSPEEEDQPLVAIVKAVAWVKGVDVRDLEPLHHVVDVDKLREHMSEDSGRSNQSSVDSDPAELEVTFQYEDCEVTVGRGTIDVQPE